MEGVSIPPDWFGPQKPNPAHVVSEQAPISCRQDSGEKERRSQFQRRFAMLASEAGLVRLWCQAGSKSFWCFSNWLSTPRVEWAVLKHILATRSLRCVSWLARWLSRNPLWICYSTFNRHAGCCNCCFCRCGWPRASVVAGKSGPRHVSDCNVSHVMTLFHILIESFRWSLHKIFPSFGDFAVFQSCWRRGLEPQLPHSLCSPCVQCPGASFFWGHAPGQKTETSQINKLATI